MRDEGLFFFPPPDVDHARLDAPGLVIAAAARPRHRFLVSGAIGEFLVADPVAGPFGPRDELPEGDHALRLAPDRLLILREAAPPSDGWHQAGYAVSDLTDGLILIEVGGEQAARLMAGLCSYDFAAGEPRPLESAQMAVAGLRIAVARRPDGFRLHVERSLAPALWTMIEQTARVS